MPYYSVMTKSNSSKRKIQDLAIPLYFIDTRDSFAFDVDAQVKYFKYNGKTIKRLEFFFKPAHCPKNFHKFLPNFPNYSLGCYSYEGVWSHEEMLEIEKLAFETEQKCFYN